MNLLFICKHNVMRSRTAESIYNSEGRHIAKSAGAARSAKVKIAAELMRWTDMVFVMEEEQKLYVKEEFGQELGHREIIIIDVYD